MKRMKKLAGFILAMLMTFAMSTVAFAATITAPSGTTHAYEIYQIFTGDLSGDVLSNVVWGVNGTGTQGETVPQDILNELTSVTALTSDTEKLAIIEKYANLNTNPVATIGGENVVASVEDGYYLIKDENGSLQGKDEAYTTYVVKIVKDIVISPKSAKPSVDKQVQDETGDKETNADSDGWGETADHHINETFKFKLIATLTADPDYAAYKTYKLIFNDTMSTGVTFESIESVTINGVTIPDNDYVCTAKKGDAGTSWSLTINDIKKYGIEISTTNATVNVIYNAHLNENAAVNNTSGSTTNENSVYLQYSNNPNTDGGGELGQTPDDRVWVFTYNVNNKKVNGENNPLAGAGFTLYESKVEDGITVADTEKAVSLYKGKDGNYYKYNTAINTGEISLTEMMSAEDTGEFNIKGLDVGTYVLVETTTPAGYNTCAPVVITISAAHNEVTETTNYVNLEHSTNMNNTIVNNTGSTLPETGGIGTTIFYVLGSILVIGAAILLITRKRMHTEK